MYLDASHELKTPLTVIESYASLVNRRGISDPKIIQEATQAILQESVRMREMIEQMLQLARYDEELVINRQATDLLEVIEQTLRSMKQAYHREFNLIVDPSFETLIYKTDEQKLKQLLFIFLDNAESTAKTKLICILPRLPTSLKLPSLIKVSVFQVKPSLKYLIVFTELMKHETAKRVEQG